MKLKRILATAAVPAASLSAMWIGGYDFQERNPIIAILYLATIFYTFLVWTYPFEESK